MANGGNPVRLAYATPQSFSPGGGISVSYTSVIVKVANIGYAKVVVLHTYGPTPADYPLPWLEWRGDHDIFGTPDQQSVPEVNEMAVSYTVNGQTYWDSLFGHNYRIQTAHTFVGGNVMLARARTDVGSAWHERVIRGELYVNNIAPWKAVGIRLSADGGSTWMDMPATYAGTRTDGAYNNAGVAELWQFTTPSLNPSSSEFRFAAYHRDLPSGITYWDNNFGHNYSLSAIPDSDTR